MKQHIKTFGEVIKGEQFDQYCEYYNLDREQTRKELTQRGYTVKVL